MKPITQPHLQIMQEIVSFVQSRGWEIANLEISKWNVRDYEDDENDKTWKQQKHRWQLTLSTAPRDDDQEEREVRV